jgi:hypothetical protein
MPLGTLRGASPVLVGGATIGMVLVGRLGSALAGGLVPTLRGGSEAGADTVGVSGSEVGRAAGGRAMDVRIVLSWSNASW